MWIIIVIRFRTSFVFLLFVKFFHDVFPFEILRISVASFDDDE